MPLAPVRLRPTMLWDLEFVTSVKTDSYSLRFVTPWDRTQQEGAARFPDFRHFVVEAGPAYELEGFVLLQGCRNPHRGVELERIVLRPMGQGVRSMLDCEYQARVALGLEGMR